MKLQESKGKGKKNFKAAVNLVERITFKRATFSLIIDSKTAAIKARTQRNNIFSVLKENNSHPRIL